MKYTDIPSHLVAIHTALVEKTNEQPFLDLTLIANQSGIWTIGLYRGYNNGDYRIATIKGDSPQDCIENAFAFIADMPGVDGAARRDWQEKLGAVIDEGYDLNLPDQVMQPLRDSSAAMTDNLLASPK